MEWSELAEHPEDYIGRDLEVMDGGVVYRGPISAIQVDAERLVITCAWTMRLLSSGQWQAYPNFSVRVRMDQGKPQVKEKDRLFFVLEHLAFGFILEPGDNLPRD